MATNSSGINGWLVARDNDRFPFHTFRGTGPTCDVCGLIRYKSVHAETADSERARGVSQ